MQCIGFIIISLKVLLAWQLSSIYRGKIKFFRYDINFICKNSVNCLQMTCNRKFEVSPNYLPELSLTGYHIVSVFIKIENRFGRLLRDLHT